MNIQWTIDSLTTLSFRPNASVSTNDGRGFSSSASFSVDPFTEVPNPLSVESKEYMDAKELIVNGRDNKSLSYNTSNNASAQLQIYRRLSRNGRNMAIHTNVNYRDNKSRNANLSAVRLYQTQNMFGQDSTYQTNRYTESPSDNLSFSAGITYTEPLYLFQIKPQPEDSIRRPFSRGRNGRRNVGRQGIFLQLNYRFNYHYQKNDPQTYDLLDISELEFQQAIEDYRDFGFLPDDFEERLSTNLSRYSERTEYGHNADVQIRLRRRVGDVRSARHADVRHFFRHRPAPGGA
jgi:hypothetical protein